MARSTASSSQGRAAHAGVEPQRGVNATVEVAHQVLTLGALGAGDSGGTSVTPTLLSAGTTTNTVPERASLAVDVRAWTSAELDASTTPSARLVPFLPEATLAVEGGINRYPMSPELARPLLEMAQSVAGRARHPGASSARTRPARPTATSPPRWAYRRWTAWARWAAGRTPPTSTSSLDRMPERTALLAGLVDAAVHDGVARMRPGRRDPVTLLPAGDATGSEGSASA